MSCLISCLCVSKNKYDVVKHAIDTFLYQTYKNRELIFIYETNNQYINEIKQQYNDSRIKYIEIEYNITNTLTKLRKLSIEYAKGEYIIQWDDDDIYHPLRIQIMYDFIVNNSIEGALLDSRIMYFEKELYLSSIHQFEGSLMVKKSIIHKYINKINNKIKKGEDTWILKYLLENSHIKFIHSPNIYIYIYHGDNVFSKSHFKYTALNGSKIVKLNIDNINYLNIFNIIEKKIGFTLQSSILNNNLSSMITHINLLLQRTYPHNDILVLSYKHNTHNNEGLQVIYNLFKDIYFYIENPLQYNNKVIFNPYMPIYGYQLLNNNNINVIYTTYEFYPLPTNWIQILNNVYDIIIVPHIEIKIIFIRSGINKPIYCIQQGYQKLINYSLPKTERFIIGFNGVPAKRKNLELVVDVIKELIIIYKDITLKVHIPKYYSELQPINFPDNIHFDITYGYKSSDELSQWYSSLDCYIFPSSGEGWSLTPRESLHLKIPTIISSCGVHHDLQDYCEMISLPIMYNKIKESIINVYNNIDTYKTKATEGSKYVNKYNNTQDTIVEVNKLLTKLSKKLDVFYLWGFNPKKDTLDYEIINYNAKFTNYIIVDNVDKYIDLYSKEYNINFKSIWNNIPRWIIKTDIARLLYLYYNPGLYLDCDAVIINDIILQLDDKNDIYVFTDTIVNNIEDLGPREKKYKLRIANYAIGSRKLKHPFIKLLIDECIRRLLVLYSENNSSVSNQDVLWVCGPDVITTVYHENISDNIQLFNNNYVKNLNKNSWK